jgi:hypothetical protein
LEGINIQVPANSTIAAGPYEHVRQELLSRMKPTRPYQPKNSLKKFLENDRRVLRFYCVWDDTNSVFGDIRHMILNYFLADDTIEIHEHVHPNSGRDANTMFLRRCKLPKRRLHNTLGVGSDTEQNLDLFYNDSDLIIGSVIHLYGRPFIICDCDGFTREYYREWYGLEHFDPVKIDEDIKPAAGSYEQELLPFFAPSISEEDITSPSSLIPNILTHTTRKDVVIAAVEKARKAAGMVPQSEEADKYQKLAKVAAVQELQQQSQSHHKVDFKKLMVYDGVTLRFSAKLDSTKQIDRDRKFVITLYIADDNISIWELKQRNSGILGGKFIEKSRVLKDDLTGFYKAADFYVGKMTRRGFNCRWRYFVPSPSICYHGS